MAEVLITVKKEEQLNIEVVSHGRLRWINIERPGEAEIEYLRQNFAFHPLDLEDCLTRSQRPKVDEYEDYLFIVLLFPLFNERARVTVPNEVDIFIGENYLITLHNAQLRPLVRFFDEVKSNQQLAGETMGKGSGYLLYRILGRLVDYCFPILNKVISNIEEVEDNIFSQSGRETVEDISLIRRDLIALRRIIRPQIGVIASLERKERAFLEEDLEAYFGDIADRIGKIWDALEDYKEVIDSLTDTNTSLTSHRINQVIKVLTIISTIMLPMSVISGIYGMNIQVLPFAETPFSFALILGFMGLIAAGMLALFRWRKWL